MTEALGQSIFGYFVDYPNKESDPIRTPGLQSHTIVKSALKLPLMNLLSMLYILWSLLFKFSPLHPSLPQISCRAAGRTWNLTAWWGRALLWSLWSKPLPPSATTEETASWGVLNGVYGIYFRAFCLFSYAVSFEVGKQPPSLWKWTQYNDFSTWL